MRSSGGESPVATYVPVGSFLLIPGGIGLFDSVFWWPLAWNLKVLGGHAGGYFCMPQTRVSTVSINSVYSRVSLEDSKKGGIKSAWDHGAKRGQGDILYGSPSPRKKKPRNEKKKSRSTTTPRKERLKFQRECT